MFKLGFRRDRAALREQLQICVVLAFKSEELDVARVEGLDFPGF
jgi:hypothetical protein